MQQWNCRNTVTEVVLLSRGKKEEKRVKNYFYKNCVIVNFTLANS